MGVGPPPFWNITHVGFVGSLYTPHLFLECYWGYRWVGLVALLDGGDGPFHFVKKGFITVSMRLDPPIFCNITYVGFVGSL